MNSNQNVFQVLWKFSGFKIFCACLLLLIVMSVSGLYVFTQVVSKDNISYPEVEHLHFRLQFVYNGEAVNFADSKFQEPYEKNQCDGGLADTPIHFHDGVNQIVHIHWKNITGGQILKYYGINYIGGLDDTLGFRLDGKLFELKKVPIMGQLLPYPENKDKFYIYTGEKNNFIKRNFDDWIKQDVETFFNKKSLLSTTYFKPNLFSDVQTYAHPSAKNTSLGIQSTNNLEQNNDNLDFNSGQLSEDELKDINNLIGNVVIFVQENEPSNLEIENKFNNLEPLTPSTCGG